MKRYKHISILTTIMISCVLLTSCSHFGNANVSNGYDNALDITEDKKVDDAPYLPLKDQMEIMTWWTGAGDEAGYKALLQSFKEKYPSISLFSSAVEGGAGMNARIVLDRRMDEGNPPDTFQANQRSIRAWAGKNKLSPLTELYKQENWLNKFPKQILDELSMNGEIYAVPLDIHRTNILWYNRKIFEELNLKVPETIEELIEVGNKIKRNGVTPLAYWTESSLLTNVLLGTLGIDNYMKVNKGELDPHSQEIGIAFNNMERLTELTDPIYQEQTWPEEAQSFLNGSVAMLLMGDWVKGNFDLQKDSFPGIDYGWLAFPGTKGAFVATIDAFGLTAQGKNQESTTQWLKFLGSSEGQDAFNPLKGSTPPRLDADISKYDSYGQESISDFKESLSRSHVLFKGLSGNIYELYQISKKNK
ncbi:ABC transporter substrate-binding protein [Paenibacillus sp. JDR-2]|uniref:ABC transporter substrate-binding protein n=1 Tax=Paenibacillus sp. (strain JDR-2) TaxID=324057 RepID=UPI000166A442|nr:ABC transporter substrate-binding protein [Paenibacillus sp. JDR-2]ACT00513.1 extracellular solute-binding protein family 1 [Paenibacillus sp. JDR-2]